MISPITGTRLVLCFSLFAAHSACLAGEPPTKPACSSGVPDLSPVRGRLAGPPAIKRGESGCSVRFALTAPNDVTVRIRDARGRVVRHLAAGMVGREKAAEPLASGALSQTVHWGGNDDTGREVFVARCKIFLGVGTRARFDKFILYNPHGFGNVGTPNWSGLGGIATGPKGELYVVQQYGVHYSTMRVFDREGRFVRAVWPLSMDKPRDTLEPFLASTMTIWPGDVAWY